MKLRILVVAAGCLMLPAMASAQVPTDTTAKPTKIDTSGPQTAGCPMGCPTSRGAAGLTGVQFLALQQELRDRGCGNGHVTGRLDAPTRRAISVCAKQLSVANRAEAVLAALNIGFGPGDNAPAGGAKSGDTGAAAATESPRPGRRTRAARAARTRMNADSTTMMRDSTMKKDSTMMMHDSTMMKKDSTMMKKDSTMMKKDSTTPKKDSIS